MTICAVLTWMGVALTAVEVRTELIKQFTTVNGTIIGKDVQTDPEGNIWLTGIFTSPYLNMDAYTITNHDITGNSSDIFLAKLSADGNVKWVIGIGGDGNDKAVALQIVNGSVVLAGNFRSAELSINDKKIYNHAAILENNSSTADFFISCFSYTSKLLWVKSGGGLQDDCLSCVGKDADGSLIAGININSKELNWDGKLISNAKTGSEEQSCTTDIMLVKLSSTGDVIWSKQYGGVNSDEVKAVTSVNDDILLTGCYSGMNMQMGDRILQSDNRGTHLWVARLDKGGNPYWLRGTSDTSFSDAYNLAVADSSIWVTGSFKGNRMMYDDNLVSIDEVPLYHTPVILKLDSNGSLEGSIVMQGTFMDTFTEVAVDSLICIAGSMQSNRLYNDNVEWVNSNGIGNADTVIAWCDKTGRIVASSKVGGNGVDYPFDLQPWHSSMLLTVNTTSNIIHFGSNQLIYQPVNASSICLFAVRLTE